MPLPVTPRGSAASEASRTPSGPRTHPTSAEPGLSRASAHNSASNESDDEEGPSSESSAGAVYHRVARGQNLYRISRQYGVALKDLCRANGIKNPADVEAGRVLLIPGVFAGRSTEDEASILGPESLATPGKPAAPAGPNQAPLGLDYSFVTPEEPFSWPIEGAGVYSGYGLRHGRFHAGIDIPAPRGSEVHASRGGEVIYSGHGYQGYGNVVMIAHRDGFVTVYAHNSKNLVRVGDSVERGETIALVGATGNATGSHCHFEIRRGEVSVDPRRYLAAPAADDPLLVRGGASARAGERLDRAGVAPMRDVVP